MSDTQSFFNDQQWMFIREIDQRFPGRRIAEKFEQYLALSPEDRITQAVLDRKNLLRSGWAARGIPTAETETIDQHTEAMKVVARNYLAQHKNLSVIEDIIDCHDTGEVIVSDFIPTGALLADPVSPQEKKDIEWLAIQVIYTAQPHRIQLYLDYAEQRTTEGKIVKDLDKGQMFLRAKQYGITHPEVDLSEFLLDCQNYEWRTQEGITIFYQAVRKVA